MQAIESIPLFKTRQAAQAAVAKEALPTISLEPEPAPLLDVRRNDLAAFVGRVVSDDDMLVLYYRAHNAGARLTSEWMADTLPCDHRVTSYN